MDKPVMLTAEDVMKRLRLHSRTKAIEVMARLPNVDLAPRGAKKRSLRITEATFDAFCNGKIQLSGTVESNVLDIAIERDHRKQRKSVPRVVEYRH